MRKWSSVAVAAALATTVLAACGSSDGSDGGSKLVSLKVGIPLPNLQGVPLWYGVDKGIFAKHGINLDVATMGGSSVVNSALASGELDVAFTSSVPFVKSVQQGVPLIAVGQSTTSIGELLVANNDWAKSKGLTADSPVSDIVNALKGANLGAASSSILTHINVLLNSNGVDPSEVKIQTLESEAAEEALLKAGKLDAFVAGPPFPYEVSDRGEGTLLITSNGADTVWKDGGISVSVVANKEWAEKNSDLMKNFLAALQEANQAVNDSPEDTVASATKQLGGDITEKVLLESYPIMGYADCVAQNSENWDKVVNYGILGDQLDAGSTAKEGEVWTNDYAPSC